MSHATKALIRMIFPLVYDFRIAGTENLPKESAFLLLPKHQCWQDIPIIAVATPRPLYFMAKHELFLNPITNWILTSMGGIPLNRQQPLRSRNAIRAMMQFLKKSEGVVVFPEGTYYPGRMGPGKGGILKLVISRLSLPLIPVGIRYNKNIFRTRVTITFGAPIEPRKKSSGDKTLSQVMHAISALSRLKGPSQEKNI